MEIFHFQAFLKSKDEEEVREEVQREIYAIKNVESLETHHVSQEVRQIMNEYASFVTETESGVHESTAQFWMGYIQMIRLYHEFTRSLRTGDLELYIQCLPNITNYFFSLNHPNYACWIVRYEDNLLKLKETHPEVYAEFKEGYFSLRRTDNAFYRLPIDLMLEQTINADAACQRKVIAALTNSISARQRWAQSHFLRTTIVSQVFQDLGLSQKKDISQDLKPSRIKQNSRDLNQINLWGRCDVHLEACRFY